VETISNHLYIHNQLKTCNNSSEALKTTSHNINSGENLGSIVFDTGVSKFAKTISHQK
jgi:hypothetical protein